jgi:predicted phosphoadenosine phosphosulfate sulfurtransferase
MNRLLLPYNVLEASKQRIKYVFDNFENIYLSFSAGKDSTVMFHLVMEEAKRRNKKVGILFIDWECQFQMTIDHAENMFNHYKNYIDLYWIQLEILTNNATSMYEPVWKSWDEDKKELWTRNKSNLAIKDKKYFPFYYDNITFEEFTPLFAKWYSKNELTACFVGIRAQESLNRFRAIARGDVNRFENKKFTVNVVDNIYNIYPLYDWKATDIWTYYSKTGLEYNKTYDLMHKAGLSIHQMRIDEPFGDEARKNLWLYHIIEPKTWSKMISRMNGINSGALYSQENGNILGNIKISLPDGHTWETFSKHLLDTMPPKTSEHYKNKIAVYINWYKKRGYPDGIPDKADYKLEQIGKVPAWRQIAKTLLKNDYWCRNLGFSITKTNAYNKYLELMRKRRNEWQIFN